MNGTPVRDLLLRLFVVMVVLLHAQTAMGGIVLADDFEDGVADEWTVVDNGLNYAPSNWSVISGVYTQRSNIWTTGSGSSSRGNDTFLGTYAYRGNSSWSDYILRARIKSDDDDQIGLMFRYQDDGNYYRFFMDKQRGFRRLEKRVGGVFTTLASVQATYQMGLWYELEVEVSGPEIRVHVDGAHIFSVTDAAISSGSIGLYCWGNEGASFDDVEVVTNTGPVDTTPPSWVDPVGGEGVCAAVDAGIGGTILVEFGGAIDAVDGANVTYRVYHAPTQSWDELDWKNNSLLSTNTPSDGTQCPLSLSLRGLENGVQYTIGVRASDQSGNEDTNSKTLSALATPGLMVLADDFEDGLADGWTVVDNGLKYAPSNWSVISGVYTQRSDIYTTSGSISRGNDTYLGTYAYSGNSSWSDYILRARIKSDDDDQIGLMFRYQDDGNYYRFFMDKQRGLRRLEKRVGGVFTTLAWEQATYQMGLWYELEVEVSGPEIRVYVDGAHIFSVTDSDISSGSIGLYCWGNVGASFDDVEVTNTVAVDTTPPSWVDPVGGEGVCSAVDAGIGGMILVEFGGAIDAVDGADVTYNVYYALTQSWDELDWKNNSLLSTSTPSGGTQCPLSLSLRELENGVQYTIGVRASDQSGNEDTNSKTLSAVATQGLMVLADNFEDGMADGWTVVDNGLKFAPSNWSVISGVYTQRSNIYTTSGNISRGNDTYLGTYAYRGNSSWSDYTLRARIKSDDDDQIGLMFRYQDDGNYYRFFMDKQRGFRRLEKRVGGVFTRLASEQATYQMGLWYELEVEVSGAEIRVCVDGAQIFSVTDSAISSGSIGLYCWGNEGASFDDVEVTNTVPVDTTPPSWVDPVGGEGVCSAVDAGSGGTILVEFGGAMDAVDGANVTYKVYYAPTQSWDELDWKNNSLPSTNTPSGGTQCPLSLSLKGLENGVPYTIGVRVSDQSGNEDTNSRTLSAVATLHASFDDGRTDNWVSIDNSSDEGNWYVQNGVLIQDVYVRGQTADGYDIGTYFIANFSDFRDAEIIVKLSSEGVDAIGVMFRYQNDDNYYRFSMSRRQGYRKIEKKVNGQFSELATDPISYTPSVWYEVRILNVGERILVYLNGEPILAAVDADLLYGSVALYNSRNTLSMYDDVEVVSPSSEPAAVFVKPTGYSVDTDYALNVEAVVHNLPPGGGVEFILDRGTALETVQTGVQSMERPFVFTAIFAGDVNVPGNHTLDAFLLNGSGERLTTDRAHDENLQIGLGGAIVVTFGDSITNGIGDDDPGDDSSLDGRTNGGGFQPLLNNLLTESTGIPYSVVDEGTPGDEAANGLKRVDTVIDRNPHAQHVLILFGTNDSSGTLPVDRGTFKGKMQQIITHILNAGKIPILGKAPIALGPCSDCTPYTDPLEADRNQLIQSYNDAINELCGENNLTNIPPDFYSYFSTHQEEFYDNLHPNGQGHRSMGNLWFQSMFNQE